MEITKQILKAIAPAAPKDVDKFVGPLNGTMRLFGINTLHRVAMFLAQLAHESDQFKAVEEYASGRAYEGRGDLGNMFKGDGVKYKGRGLIQITGRDNYKAVGAYFGADFIAYPERLEEPHWAAMAAGWFWNSRKLNDFADLPASWRSKTKKYTPYQMVTYLINGGQTHQAEREKYYGRAIVALTPLFQ